MSILQNPLLQVEAYKKHALDELERMAEDCKGSFAHDRLHWDASRQNHWRQGDWCMRSLLEPMRYQSQGPDGQGWAPQGGPFAGLTLDNILDLFFTPEATAFLLEHAYNGCIFWDNLRYIVVVAEEGAELPYSLELVRKLLVVDCTPFGVNGCSNSIEKMAKLRAAVQAAGAEFDPNKLDAAYACELLDDGFLLRHMEMNGKLVVNPMWAHLLNEPASPA